MRQQIEGCDCFACGSGIVRINFELAEASGLVAQARKDRVTIKRTDEIYVIKGVRAVACIRPIRRRLARMAGCWVAPQFRGQGYGKKLVQFRMALIANHRSFRVIDTYAFNSRLYRALGFEERAAYKIGTTLLRKVIER